MGEGGPATDAGDRVAEGSPTAGDLPAFHALAIRAAYFSLGGVAQKVVGVLLVPVLARALSTTEFGRLEVLSTLVTALTSIAVLGVDIVITRRWVDVGPEERGAMISAWLVVAAVLGGGILLVTGLAAPALSQAIFGTPDLAWPVRLVGLCATANLFGVVGLTTLRNQARARTYAAVAVIAVTVNGLLTGTLVTVRRDEAAALLGLTLATTLGAMLSLLASRGLIVRRPSRALGRSVLLGALPLVPGLVLTWGGDLAGRFLLLDLAGATEVGYFSLAIRFTTVGLLVHSGFLLAWHPRAFEIADRPGGPQRLGADTASITVVLALLTVTLAALGPELLQLLAGHRYDDALAAVGLGLVLPLATLAFTVATLPLAIGNQMRRLGVTTALAAAVSLAATAATAEQMGAAGAMLALSLGQICGALLARRLVGRHALAPAFASWRWMAIGLAAVAVAIGVTHPDGGAPVVTRVAVLLVFYAAVVIAEPALVRSGLRRFRVGLLRLQHR